MFFDWWDVPIGCIVFLISGVSLSGGCICMVFLFLFGGMLCSAVMFCQCALFCFGFCCNDSLAVLLFGCMFDVLFCCHALLLIIWLGLDVIGLVFVVGWECGVVGNVVLEVCFCMVRTFLFCL